MYPRTLFIVIYNTVKLRSCSSRRMEVAKRGKVLSYRSLSDLAYN